jgi:cyclic pyranopterin phosphate synthase
MIDVGDKEDVSRIARACGRIRLGRESIEAVRAGEVNKGDVMESARIAGTLAVKRTHELVPYCHQVPLDYVGFCLSLDDEGMACECEVRARYRTGVEMEALLGVEIALLTVWDMVKYLEKDDRGQYPSTEISEIKVIEKKKHI